jgi:hypothetical protein
MAHDRRERATPIDPLPSTQEPYITIIAPNLEHISPDTFRRGSLERRRALRGLLVLGVVVVLVAAVAIVGSVLASSR